MYHISFHGICLWQIASYHGNRSTWVHNDRKRPQYPENMSFVRWYLWQLYYSYWKEWRIKIPFNFFKLVEAIIRFRSVYTENFTKCTYSIIQHNEIHICCTHVQRGGGGGERRDLWYQFFLINVKVKFNIFDMHVCWRSWSSFLKEMFPEYL